MPKDIILYGHIGQYNAMYFFDQLSEAMENDAEANLTLRVNTEGGSPEYAMGIITKMQEIADQFGLVKVEAQAHSMGLFLLAYIDKNKIEAIDCTQAVLHRAAYPSWFESSSSFPGSIHQDIITKTNKDLEKAFRARVDVEVLEALPQMVEKSLTLKDIFATDTRHEVLLTGSDLKKIGLVGRVVKITPSKVEEQKAQARMFSGLNSLEDFKMAASNASQSKNEEKPDTVMTIEKLKAEFPAVYAAIIVLGKEEGAKVEQERVKAWMHWVKTDAEKVNAALASGAQITMSDISEMSAKAANQKALAAVEADSASATATPAGGQEPAKGAESEKEKNLEAFLSGVDNHLGIVKK